MLLRSCIFALCIATVAAAAPTCVTNTSFPEELPLTVIPNDYVLSLTLADPESGDLSFSGKTAISAKVAAATSCVILNADDAMKFTASKVQAGGKTVVATVERGENEQVILHLPTVLDPGTSISIELEYTGVVRNDSATGLFLSVNTVPDTSPTVIKDAVRKWGYHVSQREGRTRGAKRARKMLQAPAPGTPMMFATQFEESDARGMFPCFDHPSLKATFTASITLSGVDTKKDVLFNTAVQGKPTCNGTACVFNFAKTMNPLPTYLVAIAVGQFDYLSKTSNGVEYRIVTPPGYSKWATHALECSVHAADYFGKR
jgi:aminopeptidase N